MCYICKAVLTYMSYICLSYICKTMLSHIHVHLYVNMHDMRSTPAHVSGTESYVNYQAVDCMLAKKCIASQCEFLR